MLPPTIYDGMAWGMAAGPNSERARVPEALCLTVGHAGFAGDVPGWHSLITPV